MATTNLPKTFHIYYGWAEGPWHGRALSDAFKAAEFQEVPLAEATVLIAHSAGCFLIHAFEQNKIILLIGPPYWPGRSVPGRIIQKLRLDTKLHRNLFKWLQKVLWNSIYIAIKPNLTPKAWRAVHAKEPFKTVPTRAVIIQNEQDVFCTPKVASHTKNRVLVLPGQHDDCWHHPEPYIKLAEDEYAKLLA